MFIVASDHAGFELKERLKKWFDKKHFNYYDCGANNFEKDDSYVEYAKKAIEYYEKNKKENDFLILICGSGVGMNIVANRNPNIRAVLAQTAKQAEQARAHNNSNCLCLGARNICLFKARRIIIKFLKTNFLGGKYLQRINKI